MKPRSGLTLFEIAVSLAVLAVAISAALLVFPVGMKTQQNTRYRLLAGSLALRLQAEFLKISTMDGMEGYRISDRPHTNSQGRTSDLDTSGGVNFAFVPVPQAIASRLSSDREQLAGYLAEGATLLYAPNAVTVEGPAAQRLVLCVTGYPQNNLLRMHPQMRAPYCDFYPMAYDSRRARGDANAPMARSEKQLIQAARDASLLPTAELIDNDNALSNDVPRLRLALIALGIAVGVDNVITPVAAPSEAALAAEYTADRLRYNARLLVLRYFSYWCGHLARAQNSFGYASTTYPDSNLLIRAHQVANEWMMAYYGWITRWQPYDQANSRDAAQTQAWNYPLMQFDPMATPLRNGSGSGIMHAWPVRSSLPFRAEGNDTFTGAIDTCARPSPSPAGWTATRAFSASERCRQVVIYAVDWMQYQDAETAPGAPMDASLLTFLPTNNDTTSWTSGNPQPVSCGWPGSLGHPERTLFWHDATRTKRISDSGAVSDPESNFYRDSGTAAAFLGRYGADRNQNGLLDKGPVDPSVRLRATLVARFNLYDPIGFVQEH